MTNAESYLETAIERRDNNELSAWEDGFITDMEDFDKKDLKSLSSKQFLKLRKIAS